MPGLTGQNLKRACLLAAIAFAAWAAVACQTTERQASDPSGASFDRRIIFTFETALQPGLNENVPVQLDADYQQRRIEIEIVGDNCDQVRLFHEGVLPAINVTEPSGILLHPLTPTKFVDGGVQSNFTVREFDLDLQNSAATALNCTINIVADYEPMTAIPLGTLPVWPGFGGGYLQLLPPTKLALTVRQYELVTLGDECQTELKDAWSVAPDTLPAQTGRQLQVEGASPEHVLRPEGAGVTLNRAIMLEARRLDSSTGDCELEVTALLSL